MTQDITISDLGREFLKHGKLFLVLGLLSPLLFLVWAMSSKNIYRYEFSAPGALNTWETPVLGGRPLIDSVSAIALTKDENLLSCSGNCTQFFFGMFTREFVEKLEGVDLSVAGPGTQKLEFFSDPSLQDLSGRGLMRIGFFLRSSEFSPEQLEAIHAKVSQLFSTSLESFFVNFHLLRTMLHWSRQITLTNSKLAFAQEQAAVGRMALQKFRSEKGRNRETFDLSYGMRAEQEVPFFQKRIGELERIKAAFEQILSTSPRTLNALKTAIALVGMANQTEVRDWLNGLEDTWKGISSHNTLAALPPRLIPTNWIKIIATSFIFGWSAAALLALGLTLFGLRNTLNVRSLLQQLADADAFSPKRLESP